ncbi:hypothetical protein Tco_0058851 [Tanacetum coccineum]
MTTSSTNKSVFKGFFEKQKLTGPNFIDWYRQLWIVLSIDDSWKLHRAATSSAPVSPAGHACCSMKSFAAQMLGFKDQRDCWTHALTIEQEIPMESGNISMSNDMLKGVEWQSELASGLSQVFDGVLMQFYNMHKAWSKTWLKSCMRYAKASMSKTLNMPKNKSILFYMLFELVKSEAPRFPLHQEGEEPDTRTQSVRDGVTRTLDEELASVLSRWSMGQVGYLRAEGLRLVRGQKMYAPSITKRSNFKFPVCTEIDGFITAV